MKKRPHIKKRDNPDLARLYYIRGILRNRITVYDDDQVLWVLKQALKSGCSVDDLESHAKNVRNWSQWKSEITEMIDGI